MGVADETLRDAEEMDTVERIFAALTFTRFFILWGVVTILIGQFLLEEVVAGMFGVWGATLILIGVATPFAKRLLVWAISGTGHGPD